jgi:ribosomal-protein-alanine N-acetyltransferase
MEMIQITRVDVEQIIDLRQAVLRIGLPRTDAYFPGDAEPTTVHLAAKTRSLIIGCATILLNEWNGQPACQLRGMAVDPAHQRLGLGSKLLADAHRIAREKGVTLIWANARKPAALFYEKHGWKIASEEFDIPKAGPHYKMIFHLPV